VKSPEDAHFIVVLKVSFSYKSSEVDRSVFKNWLHLAITAEMEPASGSGRFRISEGDWICSDPQYATHCGFA
jgi:hypothetical protein